MRWEFEGVITVVGKGLACSYRGGIQGLGRQREEAHLKWRRGSGTRSQGKQQEVQPVGGKKDRDQFLTPWSLHTPPNVAPRCP